MSMISYRTIPDPPSSYSSAAVLSRMLDGLGYRFYWASEGLTDEVLEYRAGATGRSVGETIGHVYNLVQMIEYALSGRTYPIPEPDIPEGLDVRVETLNAIKRVSEAIRDTDPERIGDWKARFHMGGNDLEFPFWNMINGPMCDAVYHTGQIVAYRRAAGLPMDPTVNVFTGHNDAGA